ncbi:MAG TPA: transglutaminase-like domain-containing protein, partial [Candidatus Binataceae bacterium]|nr:transglutaminase-like domain-containing protein [Candidatus Binataceae bacterium]
MNPARTEFARIAAREPIPLAHGALLIAKEEYPDLDVAHYLEHLAALGRAAQSALREAENTVERVQTLSDFLFVRTGFAGNRDHYGDPRNSFLNDVLERRIGIPITLSVIYLEIGRRAGLNLFGVSFPSHFLVKAVDERGELIIDPFNGGAILDLDDIRTRLKQIYGQPVEVQPAMLKAVGGRHILARMLRNLKN